MTKYKEFDARIPRPDYIEDAEGYLKVACWRLRVMCDPWLAQGRLLAGEEEDEDQRWNSSDAGDISEDEDDSCDAE